MLGISLGLSRRGIGPIYKNGGRYSSMLYKSRGRVKIDTIISHPAFEVIENTALDEYGVQALLYKHKKTGAQVISIIAPEDNNKVFGITLRTPPKDSTGVPHILEHSVLCGSRKYPVKEPFVDLLKGSLQNFLNAFTYPDRTCYPVASTNTKDFYNLVSVYLDAVLHPRAVSDPQVLQQEGWHLELENADDPLTYKGVVYNEMKGVYSSPESILGKYTQQALFPDNTYGVDSGGDPLAIPDLTFADFKEFHRKFYHPSNSRVFFYGDDDPLQRLVLLDKELATFDRIDIDSAITYQQKHKKPERLQIAYPVIAGSEAKHFLTVNWLLNDQPISSKESLALGVLDTLLLGTSSSKLFKILTESQLGESVTGGGLSDELLQATFGVGLKGVKPADVDRVEELILSSVATIAKDGFEQSAVDAAINTLEFRLREFNTGGYPKGLSFMLGMMGHWIYDQDAFDGVRFEESLNGLKADLAAGKPVFQDLIEKYILSNQHRVTVDMKPDEGMEKQQLAEEESRLSAIKSQMTPEQINRVIQDTAMLKEAQAREDSMEAKATLPRLSLEDIDPLSQEFPLNVVREGGSKSETILTHEFQTSGILYVDVAFDFSHIEAQDLELLPLFTRLMTEGGTSTLDEAALQHKIGTYTGGIGTSTFTGVTATPGVVSRLSPDDSLLYFMMRGKAVAERVDTLLELFQDMLLNANFNNKKRAVEMLKESKSRKETAVITSGHSYAASRLASKYSFLGRLGEVTGGLTAVRNAGTLLAAAEGDWENIYKRLKRMQSAIVKKNGMVINLTADRTVLSQAMPRVERFVSVIPSLQPAMIARKPLIDDWQQDSHIPTTKEGFYVPSQVNFVVKGGPIYNPGEAVSGSTSVVSRYLSLNYLWDTVRVMGGAYGGFARFSDTTGRFVFSSYRDPNLKTTLDAYDQAPKAILDAEISDEDILQGVIGSVGDLDSPLSADQKGYASMIRYLTRESATDRQLWRDQILRTSAADFIDFANRLDRVTQHGSVVVFGSQTALEEANGVLDKESKLKIESAY